MNEDKKKAEGPSVKDQQYHNLKLLFDSMSCMTATEEKVKFYNKLADDFNKLGDFQDAKELSKQCKVLAREAKILSNDAKLVDARELVENAKSADDLNKADKLLKELKDYKDAAEIHALCKNSYDKLLKKRRRGVYTFYLVVACAIVLIIFSRVNLFRFQLGRVVGKAGMNRWAVSIFTDLDGYKNSDKYLQEYSYKVGNDIMSGENLGKKDYDKAKDAFLAADGYKKANQWIAEIEQKQLTVKNVGEKIRLGNTNWVIAEKQDNKALLVKVDGILDLPYSIYEGNVTWENSSLRNYLNTQFLENNFTKEECNYILETQVISADNSQYHTLGGNDTVDRIFILSAEEQLKYKEVLKNHGNNSWLRNPGASPGTAIFLTPKGQIMYYGYTAASEDLLTVPAFWYQLD